MLSAVGTRVGALMIEQYLQDTHSPQIAPILYFASITQSFRFNPLDSAPAGTFLDIALQNVPQELQSQ